MLLGVMVLIIGFIRPGNLGRAGLSHGFHLGHLTGAVIEHDFYAGGVEIGQRAVADLGQPIPFIHAKFAHANFDIQAKVVVRVDLPFGQVDGQHFLMCLLAAFDLGDEFPFGFGKGAQTPSKAFPPFGLFVWRAARAFARAYAEEKTDGLARPLIEDSFVQDLRGRIVGGSFVGVGEAITLVLEGGCSYSNLFEG